MVELWELETFQRESVRWGDLVASKEHLEKGKEKGEMSSRKSECKAGCKPLWDQRHVLGKPLE